MWTSLTKKVKQIQIESGTVFLALLISVCIAIPLKLFLFYVMMDTSANFIGVWLITCVLIYLLFASFNNKWIPAILFLLVSFIMFADAAYASFFNRYLSLNMIGAAGLLGGVQESVKEIVKPKFFLLFTDSVLIIVTLLVGILYKRHQKKSISVEDQLISQIQTMEPKKHLQLKTIISKIIHPMIAVLLIAVLILGSSSSLIIASAANQEFFSYHLKDLARKTLIGDEELYVDPNEMVIATGTYENEISGPLFGIAKDRNLIVIQVESLQNMVVNVDYNGYEITPNLNRLINDNSIYFDNFYEQRGSGNTSDAEFASNNSIYGSIESYTYGLYNTNYFRGLPWLLKDKGYSTAAFHGYKKDFWSREAAYPSQGFDVFYSEKNYDPVKVTGMGIDDVPFFDQSIDYMLKMQQPFYSFLITLSNHYTFKMPKEYLKIPLKSEDEGTIFGNYINSVNHTDEALGTFIQGLKDAGLYENSIIAIYGDHFGLTPNDSEIFKSISRYLGKEYDFDTMMNVPLIIHIPGSGLTQTVSISGGHLDFMPTMSYLLGLEKLNTLYFGQNLLTASSGFVAEQAYMTKGSFIKDNVIFEMSRDGVFANSRAWNKETGEAVALETLKSDYLRSKMIIDSSEYYLKNDILRKVLVENQTAETLFKDFQVLAAPKKIVIAGMPDPELVGANSRTALDTSYDNGSKYIKIKLSWSADGKTEMRAKDGVASMSFGEIANWMNTHKDAYLIMEQNENMVYLLDGIKAKYPEIRERVIPEMINMEEYSRASLAGFPNMILTINDGIYTEQKVIDFIELNKVWATSISEASISDNIEALIKAKKRIYSRSDWSYTLVN